MPGFTHMQIAQPVTFGHHLMAWYEMLKETYIDWQILKKNGRYASWFSCLSGTRFKINRRLLAKKLGFREISNNSMDAVSDQIS